MEYYRQIFSAFKEMCATGKQPCSFREYCKEKGVSYSRMYLLVKDEFPNICAIPGYRRCTRTGILCSMVYEEFRDLCSNGNQPGSFTDFCKGFGISYQQMHDYLKRNNLRVVGLPGYSTKSGNKAQYKEIPFEDVIFEEAGFLPANIGNVITVRVDGHVEVSFPYDTDISVVAGFIRKMRKEAGHVGA